MSNYDTKELKNKVDTYANHKFQETSPGYDPNDVDHILDSILIDFQLLVKYSSKLEELNTQLQNELLKTKEELKELKNVNNFLSKVLEIKEENEN